MDNIGESTMIAGRRQASGSWDLSAQPERASAYAWDVCTTGAFTPEDTIRILTWNTLADGLAQHGDFEKVRCG